MTEYVCCIPGCPGPGSKDPDLFHPIPKGSSKKEQWLSNIAAAGNSTKELNGSESSLCSRHFVDTDYVVVSCDGGVTMRFISPDAVPSVFDNSSSNDSQFESKIQPDSTTAASSNQQAAVRIRTEQSLGIIVKKETTSSTPAATQNSSMTFKPPVKGSLKRPYGPKSQRAKRTGRIERRPVTEDDDDDIEIIDEILPTKLGAAKGELEGSTKESAGSEPDVAKELQSLLDEGLKELSDLETAIRKGFRPLYGSSSDQQVEDLKAKVRKLESKERMVVSTLSSLIREKEELGRQLSTVVLDGTGEDIDSIRGKEEEITKKMQTGKELKVAYGKRLADARKELADASEHHKIKEELKTGQKALIKERTVLKKRLAEIRFRLETLEATRQELQCFQQLSQI